MKGTTKHLLLTVFVCTAIAIAYACRMLAKFDIGGPAVNHIRTALYLLLFALWGFSLDPQASFGSVQHLKKGDPRYKGGALCDHPHIFDLIRHLTGSDFDYIYAEVAPNLRDGLKVEDMLMAIGKMKDGTSFLFDPSWSRLEEKIKVPGPGWERFPKRMEVNVTITGDKGMLTCDCFGPNVYHNGAPNDRYTVQYTPSEPVS